MRWAFAQCSWLELPVCDNGMSCMLGCAQVCLILWILNRKNTMAARTLVSQQHSFIRLRHEQIAKLWGGGEGVFSAWNWESINCYCISVRGPDTIMYYPKEEYKKKKKRIQRLNNFFKWPYETDHIIQCATENYNT